MPNGTPQIIEFVLGDRAGIDVEDLPAVPKRNVSLRSPGRAVVRDAIAIVPEFFRRENRSDVEPPGADSFESVANVIDFLFCGEIRWKVLIVASAATVKVRALRFDTMRGRPKNFQSQTPAVPLSNVRDLQPDEISRSGSRDENGESSGMGDSVAAVSEAVHGGRKNFSNRGDGEQGNIRVRSVRFGLRRRRQRGRVDADRPKRTNPKSVRSAVENQVPGERGGHPARAGDLAFQLTGTPSGIAEEKTIPRATGIFSRFDHFLPNFR